MTHTTGSIGKVSKPTDNERLSKSCDHCKLKKIKCDQRKPICENCTKNNQECVYSVMKRPGLKVGYGQQFITRMDALDKVVESNQSETAVLKEQYYLLESQFQMLEQQVRQTPLTPLDSNRLMLANENQRVYNHQLFDQIDKLNQALESAEARHLQETNLVKNQIRSIEELVQKLDKRVSNGVQMDQNGSANTLLHTPKRGSLSYVINEADQDRSPPDILSRKTSQVQEVFSLDNEIKDLGDSSNLNESINGNEPDNNSKLYDHKNEVKMNSNDLSSSSNHINTHNINTECLPSVDKIIVLVDLYFNYINPIFPVVHRDLEGPRILKNINSSNVLLLGVLINALKFGNEMLSEQEITGYFDYMKLSIITSCFSMKNTTELKAMTLLAFALYSKANSHEAWSTVSMVVGGCLHLALNRDQGAIVDPSLNKLDTELDAEEEEDEMNPNSSDWIRWVSKESLRHLVWEIYKLDKLSSMGTHFSSKLPSNDLTCLLPIKSKYWELQHLFNKELLEGAQKRTLADSREMKKFNQPDIYGINCYVIEILNLVEACLKFRRHPVEVKDRKDILSWQMCYYEIETKIKEWLLTLPPLLEEFLNKGNLKLLECSKPKVDDVILHGLYHTMIIRLHSLTAFSQSKDESMDFLPAQTSKKHCLNSARSILKLSESLPFFFNIDGESVYELFGPYYAFAVWVSGRVLLVDSIHSQGQLDHDFDYAISLLRKIGRKWDCASKYADILEFFKDDTMSIDTVSPDGPSLLALNGGLASGSVSYGDDARIIADIKLTSSSLDSLLSKKIARYKATKGSSDDLWVFDWFKLPLNENFNRENF